MDGDVCIDGNGSSDAINRPGQAGVEVPLGRSSGKVPAAVQSAALICLEKQGGWATRPDEARGALALEGTARCLTK